MDIFKIDFSAMTIGHFDENHVIYGLSGGSVKQWGFVAISAINALRRALLNGNSTFI